MHQRIFLWWIKFNTLKTINFSIIDPHLSSIKTFLRFYVIYDLNNLELITKKMFFFYNKKKAIRTYMCVFCVYLSVTNKLVFLQPAVCKSNGIDDNPTTVRPWSNDPDIVAPNIPHAYTYEIKCGLYFYSSHIHL